MLQLGNSLFRGANLPAYPLLQVGLSLLCLLRQRPPKSFFVCDGKTADGLNHILHNVHRR